MPISSTPSPIPRRISQIVIANPDPELHLAIVQAYNDWLIEYCGHDPSRLCAIILLPNRGVDQAVAEIERLAGRTGVVGALAGCFPHGDKDLAVEDDRVWQALVSAKLPLHIHVGLVDSPPTDIYAPGKVTAGRAAGDLRFLQAPAIMVQFLNGGVFDRVPGLDIVMVEVDAGWVPYVKEQLDNRFPASYDGSGCAAEAVAERNRPRPHPLHVHHRQLRSHQPPPRRCRPALVVERLPALRE
jgi:predicted TIM-barrel fold metal-dependent hydrolase